MKDIQILIIEDEATLRDNIAEIIVHYGFRVITAPSGEEGVKVATQVVPDIIVCDLMLPGIDGYEVLNAVKQIPGLISTAFIFLTAKSTRSDIRTGMDMGADDYLTKPFTKEELINSIKARVQKLINLRASQIENDAFISSAAERMTILTKAERKVLNKISEGFTTPQIAEKLFLSSKTIENHRMNISRKLSLSGPNSLISFALRLKAHHFDQSFPEKPASPLTADNQHTVS
jgi:two-component system, OmpR family, response regulator